jgi:preprotein translocase subunit SecD
MKERLLHIGTSILVASLFVGTAVVCLSCSSNPPHASPEIGAPHGSGVLEFHILADEQTPVTEVQEMIKRLQTQGPATGTGDKLRWYQASHPEEFSLDREAGHPQDYQGNRYVLTSIEPRDSMIHKQGETPWGLTSAYVTTNQIEQQCIGFQFDPQGATLFSELTGNHLPTNSHRYCLAILLDDKVISAPSINTQIGAQGIIEGGRAGYSDAELKFLINTLNAGSLRK